MNCRVSVLAGSILCAACGSLASLPLPYDPGVYIYLNNAVIEGRLLADFEVAAEECIEDQEGWRFPTSRANVVVDRVVYLDDAVTISPGDTISLRYRTSGIATKAGETGIRLVTGRFESDMGVNVGSSAVFSVRVLEDGDLRRGIWCPLEDERVSGVEEFIKSLAADSSLAIEALRQRSTLKIDWETKKIR